MCRFISMAVEDAAKAKDIFAGYVLWANTNMSFKSEVPPRFASLWVTDAHCSCSLYSTPYDPEDEADKLRKRFSKPKYRKKGWSQERIEQEVANILSKPKEPGGLSAPLFAALQEYATDVGRIYLHVGWYNGDQTKQSLKINGYSTGLISSANLDASQIQEDILYTLD